MISRPDQHPQQGSSTERLPSSRLLTDWQFFVVLGATVLTGLGLHWLLPAGYSDTILTQPWSLLTMLVLSPVIEEWVFRGVLQGELLRQSWGKKQLWGLTAANGLTSIVFVLVHAVYYDWLWALSVIFPSLVLGYFRERYMRLWVPMMLHGLFNLNYLLSGLSW